MFSVLNVSTQKITDKMIKSAGRESIVLECTVIEGRWRFMKLSLTLLEKARLMSPAWMSLQEPGSLLKKYRSNGVDVLKINALNSFSQTYLLAPRTRDRPSHQANLQKQSPVWPWEGLQLQDRIYSRILCIDILSFPHHRGKYCAIIKGLLSKTSKSF